MPKLFQRAADDAAQHRVGDLEEAQWPPTFEWPQQPLDHAVPVGGHAERQLLGGEHRGRPFDAVNLGHRRGVLEPRVVEDLIARPGGMLGPVLVAEVVVMRDEQRVEQLEADPHVAREA